MTFKTLICFIPLRSNFLDTLKTDKIDIRYDKEEKNQS